MLRDRERIAREMAESALVRLHRKLERLSSVLTVMNTGAHPDDEANGMLAALRFGFGMRVVIACSTRGEGGQNAIGPERGGALGVLRTREMEEAARVLDADVAWLGHGPGDPVHDFGFSKNGDDTLSRWGEDCIVERLVRAYREHRPDIVIPTFLDVPGQHGHHRAMTRAARTAFDRAADPAAYPHHAAEGLTPWRVSKFYLPAWSGGGGTYDDEVPPPQATLLVQAPETDVATGVPFARIGEWSRAKHLSQGMGVWLEEPPHDWPLHLLVSGIGEPGKEADIREGLPATLADLARIRGVPPEAASWLRAAQRAIGEAREAFPHRPRILDAATRAEGFIRQALDALPEPARDTIGHRLTRKLRELDAVIMEAGGIAARAWADPSVVAPGGRTTLHVSVDAGDWLVTAEPILAAGISAVGRTQSGNVVRFVLEAAEDASFTELYPAGYRALGGNGDVAVALAATHGRARVQTLVDLEEPLRIAPKLSLALDPEAVVVNLSHSTSPFAAKLRSEGDGAEGDISVAAPSGWVAALAAGRLHVEPPAALAPGLYRIAPHAGGRPTYRSTSIRYPHIGETAHLQPEALHVLALDIALPPDARVAYIGGGNDRVGIWLSRLGLPVAELNADALRDDLSRFTTIVVGIFAFGTCPGLAAASAALHRFVERGGHLVTLYHRPADGWDPATVPPRPIEIGSPSLRWRVTDPSAPVTILEADHPLLSGPNRIGPEDWAGWDKERGLYFASRWDHAYKPLLALSDKGEKPLLGALISGVVGAGRHTHVSLVLHHQLDRLVPGAFRLLANLVQPA